MELTSKKRYYKGFILLAFLLSAATTIGQCDAPDLPRGAAFKTPSDFKSQDAKAAECLNWLLNKESFECEQDREGVNAFVLVWLSGHPEFTVSIDTDVMPFLERYPELLFPMIHGCALYELSTNAKERSETLALVNGLKAVDRFSRSHKKWKKDADLKEIHRLIRKKKINKWVEEKKNMN